MNSIFSILLNVHIILYLLMAIYTLYKCKEDLKEVFADSLFIRTSWYILPIAGMAVLVTIEGYFVFRWATDQVVNSNVWIIMGLIESNYVFLLGIVALYQPSLFLKESITEVKKSSTKNLVQYSQLVKNQLEKLMLEKRVYLRSDLTLPELADMLELNHHELSEVLNTHIGKNFYQYINGYRVKHAKDFLSRDEAKEKTMQYISDVSGFNNKTSFYNAFKKETGFTPKAYSKSIQ